MTATTKDQSFADAQAALRQSQRRVVGDDIGCEDATPDPDKRSRTVLWALVIALAVAVVAIGFYAPRASAAEPEREPPSPRTHQLTVCMPDSPCERRGRPMGATACSLDAASEKLLAGLPSGTLITCVRVEK